MICPAFSCEPFTTYMHTTPVCFVDGCCRCCAFAPEHPSNEDEQSIPRIYVGTQPADLIYSDDLGGSFTTCSLSAAPAADSWYRRLPPYEPSVRAINFAGSSVAAAAAAEDVQQPDLLVAVEVRKMYGMPGPSPANARVGQLQQGVCMESVGVVGSCMRMLA